MLLTITLFMLMSLTACGKFTCQLCGEEKSGRSYKETVLGEEIIICKDCHDDLEELREGFGF